MSAKFFLTLIDGKIIIYNVIKKLAVGLQIYIEMRNYNEHRKRKFVN